MTHIYEEMGKTKVQPIMRKFVVVQFCSNGSETLTAEAHTARQTRTGAHRNLTNAWKTGSKQLGIFGKRFDASNVFYQVHARKVAFQELRVGKDSIMSR